MQIIRLLTILFQIQGASLKEEEDEFVKVLESRAAAAEGKIEVVDINKKKSTVEVTELITLSKVIEDLKAEFPGLVSYKVTFIDSPIFSIRLARHSPKLLLWYIESLHSHITIWQLLSPLGHSLH